MNNFEYTIKKKRCMLSSFILALVNIFLFNRNALLLNLHCTEPLVFFFSIQYQI